jgi:hypothetical protein
MCDDDLAKSSDIGETFTIKNISRFAKEEIPKYYEHNNFSSFTRQLHFYGFKKMPQKIARADVSSSASHIIFHDEDFKRGRIKLLQKIHRSTNNAGVLATINYSQEVKVLTTCVTPLETQFANLKEEYECLKPLVSSFLLYQKGVASYGEEQMRKPLQKASNN